MTEPIRLGTRRSNLAMAQSGQVARALEVASGRTVELVPITSEGDTNRASLASLGGTGVFATRLREALLDDRCDVLVHSLKDLPTAPAPGLVVAGMPTRVDPRDVIITRDGTPLEELPAGSRVGTGSPRRMAQVRRANPSVEIFDLRGNVDSRMARVRDGELDAIVLAAAGLGRLGAEIDLHVAPRELAEWPTAAGQGVLAVEIREDAPEPLRTAVASLTDPVTAFAQEVERSALAGIEAGCHAPVGIHAFVAGEEVRVRADVYAPDDADSVTLDERWPIPPGVFTAEAYSRGSGSDEATAGAYPRARTIGNDVARRLLVAGAAGLVADNPS
ncbi:hydroxymethylbilane synthase [Microbacterium halophytorum]|uniref:hydroxymethylbilane synthase n=1 Tax=Microbacterium halophytorum TaxID=2067568 RepID=UPI000CFE0293|nr:hydroxymethylbilane synthase [Microbacterium halophytorum]